MCHLSLLSHLPQTRLPRPNACDSGSDSHTQIATRYRCHARYSTACKHHTPAGYLQRINTDHRICPLWTCIDNMEVEIGAPVFVKSREAIPPSSLSIRKIQSYSPSYSSPLHWKHKLPQEPACKPDARVDDHPKVRTKQDNIEKNNESSDSSDSDDDTPMEDITDARTRTRRGRVFQMINATSTSSSASWPTLRKLTYISRAVFE